MLSSVLLFLIRGLFSGGLDVEIGCVVFGVVAGGIYWTASFLTYVAFSRGSFYLTSLNFVLCLGANHFVRTDLSERNGNLAYLPGLFTNAGFHLFELSRESIGRQ